MRDSSLRLLIILTLGLTLCLPGWAGAAFISNTSSFGSGPDTVIKGFEGITPGSANTLVTTYGNWALLGPTSTYIFASGITLAAPQPPQDDSNNNIGPYVNDSKAANASQPDWLMGNGYSAAPFGTAYLGIWRTGTAFHLTFTFIKDVYRAGAYFTGLPEATTGSYYYVRALDAAGHVLEEDAIRTVNVSAWGRQLRGHRSFPSGFRQLDFYFAGGMSPGQINIDNLTVEYDPPPSSVPLPASVLLLGSGLVGLGLLGFRRRH